VPSWIVQLLSRVTQCLRGVTPMSRWLLSVSVSMLLALPANGQDDVGYGVKETCKDAIDAESARGSALIEPPGPPNPVMKDFYGAIEFERTFNGAPAKIIYLCEGTKVSGGSIVAQLIYIDRGSENEARAEFAKQKQWLEMTLVAPCWDPSRLSESQQALLSPGKRPEEVLGPRTIWRAAPRIYTDISWNYVRNAAPARWQVLIHSHGPGDMSRTGEPFLTLYRMSSCERPAPGSTSPQAK
jgi:hypothetical protein